MPRKFISCVFWHSFIFLNVRSTGEYTQVCLTNARCPKQLYAEKWTNWMKQRLTFAINCGSNIQVLLIVRVVPHPEPFPSSRPRRFCPIHFRFSIEFNANFSESQFLVCFQINVAVYNLSRIETSISINFNCKQIDCFHNANAGYIFWSVRKFFTPVPGVIARKHCETNKRLLFATWEKKISSKSSS